MFGFSRKKVTIHVVSFLRPFVAIIQHNYGLPVGFWQDEYVLGFFGFLISFHMNETSGIRLSQVDKGQVLVDAFSAISNMNGLAISRKFLELANLPNKSPDFEQAGDNAAILAYASIGNISIKCAEYVDIAKSIAAARGEEYKIETLLGYLMIVYFVEPIKQRFHID